VLVDHQVVDMPPERRRQTAVVDGGNLRVSSDSDATWVADGSVGATQSWRAVAMSASGVDDGSKCHTPETGMWQNRESNSRPLGDRMGTEPLIRKGQL
jgi:hypothetical protein